MNYPRKIIQRFGGVRPMARALDAPPSTIQSWSDVGYIPAQRHQEVIDAAIREGIKLKPADFFEAA